MVGGGILQRERSGDPDCDGNAGLACTRPYGIYCGGIGSIRLLAIGNDAAMLVAAVDTPDGRQRNSNRRDGNRTYADE